MEVDVEVVDAPLDYNLLLGHNWTYAMTTVVSSVFCTLCFPHEGKIVTIDQLSFVHASPSASVGPSVPVIDNSQQETEDVGVRMYSSLMGSFDFMAPIHHIHAISSESSSSMRLFLSVLHISMTLGPYLPRLCRMKVSHTLGWKCHCQQQKLCIRLF
jgi:hypothetical protein